MRSSWGGCCCCCSSSSSFSREVKSTPDCCSSAYVPFATMWPWHVHAHTQLRYFAHLRLCLPTTANTQTLSHHVYTNFDKFTVNTFHYTKMLEQTKRQCSLCWCKEQHFVWFCSSTNCAAEILKLVLRVKSRKKKTCDILCAKLTAIKIQWGSCKNRDEWENIYSITGDVTVTSVITAGVHLERDLHKDSEAAGGTANLDKLPIYREVW